MVLNLLQRLRFGLHRCLQATSSVLSLGHHCFLLGLLLELNYHDQTNCFSRSRAVNFRLLKGEPARPGRGHLLHFRALNVHVSNDLAESMVEVEVVHSHSRY